MRSGRGPAISLWLRRGRAGGGAAWIGVAEADGELVATSVARTRDEAYRALSRALPAGALAALAEGRSAFADDASRMIAAAMSGEEAGARLDLSPAYFRSGPAAVYRLVAAIPIGYAASYGRVATAAGVTAREVGRLMATNPLYPLVPCHRVVGADYSLVGYRGATSGPDLADKLARLRAEARGYAEELKPASAPGLVVFPVERVLARAERGSSRPDRQLPLW
jgi:methylated-DNA-[protein]-cysteine S-methyltransferase